MHMEGHYFKELKTVPVNFVVDTVLYYYCVDYEIYWNSLYFKYSSIWGQY